MKNWYSPSKNAFFSEEKHGNNIPADAIEKNEQDFEALKNSQSQGFAIVPSDDGEPICISCINLLSIDDLANFKRKAVQQEKCRLRDSGVIVDGILFDTDAGARLAYLELSTQFALDSTFVTEWKASTGQWVTMDAALFEKVIEAGKLRISELFTWQSKLDAQITIALATNNKEALLSIVTNKTDV